MHVLMEHVSCLVNEQEFPEIVKTGYKDIYVMTGMNGMGQILRHVKLKGGRFVRIPVKEIPGLKQEDFKSEIRPEINFLPNGRVPAVLLEEIVQFFKEVMNVKKADNEAMAHILWNEKDKDQPNKGYRIAIPNQTVSKASVKYEHDHIERNDVIVLDIHSHNTMGAFFSGTDDGDDKKGIFFSGVVGELNHREPAFKWRLNINETKIEADMDDIFDIEKKEVKIPEEWLERVKTNEYTTYSNGYTPTYQTGGQYSGKNYTPAWERNTRSSSNESASGSESWRNNGNSHSRGEHNFDNGGYGDEGLGGYPWGNGVSELYPNEASNDSEENNTSPSSTGEKSGQTELALPKLPAPRTSKSNKKVHSLDRDDSLPLLIGEYDAMAINHGKEAAEAYEQVTAWLGNMEGNDELLLDIMSITYRLLSVDGQGRLAEKGL